MKITIEGSTGEGCSTVSLLIANALKQVGLKSSLEEKDMIMTELLDPNKQELRLRSLRERQPRIDIVQVRNNTNTSKL